LIDSYVLGLGYIGKKEENFKVYEAEYEYPYIRCPKCKYKESVL
jgi:hypothetical protein